MDLGLLAIIALALAFDFINGFHDAANSIATVVSTRVLAAPLLGLGIALILGVAVYWAFRKWTPGGVDALFRKGQLLSAALYSLGHGGNDAQKTMGIISILLFSSGLLGPVFFVPLWVVL